MVLVSILHLHCCSAGIFQPKSYRGFWLWVSFLFGPAGFCKLTVPLFPLNLFSLLIDGAFLSLVMLFFCGLPLLSQSWVPGDLLCVGCLGNSQQPFLGSCRGMDVLVFLYPFLPRYFSHMVVSFVSSIGLWPGLLLKGVSYHVFHILHLGLTSCWKLGHASPV